MEWVERFYSEYYFRPKVAWRIVRKAMFDGHERKRLYKEAREYLSLRGKRKQFIDRENNSLRPCSAVPKKPRPDSSTWPSRSSSFSPTSRQSVVKLGPEA